MYEWKGKRVVIMGLGLHGGGTAAAGWFCRHGARVTVTDLKPRAELADSLQRLRGLPITYVLGRHRRKDFLDADVIVQNPGVEAGSPYLKVARQAGARIENEASIFFQYCPAPIIGVTGTRGKSTVSALMAKLLAYRGKRVWLAGNIRITPMLAILDGVRKNDVVVLELSSWHLEVMAAHRQSPHVAVLTNISADHLNRYPSMQAYVAAKAAIFAFQKPTDLAVVNRENSYAKKIGQRVRARRVWFSQGTLKEENAAFVRSGWIVLRRAGRLIKLAPLKKIKLPGEHNLQNALAACAVAGWYGVPATHITKVLASFSGLADRLELVRTIDGIAYINDTTATSPDGLRAALQTLGNRRRQIVLIAGGADKRLPASAYAQVRQLINRTCKAAVLFKGAGTKKIGRLNIPTVQGVKTMADALGIARRLSKIGDVVLLSPGCASFGLFMNEFDRGGQFRRLVKKL